MYLEKRPVETNNCIVIRSRGCCGHCVVIMVVVAVVVVVLLVVALVVTIQDGFHVAALNYVVSKGATEEEDLLSVTLCTRSSPDTYLEKEPTATLLKPQHAWHHPATFLKS